jgi:Hemerythrin HHE cation binding domain
MSRRHDSLIPLSRQHNHALTLALIIRRRDGLDEGESTWLEKTAAKIRNAYAVELAGHFEVEEAVLFPEMEKYLGKLELAAQLIEEHKSLRGLVQRIETAPTALLFDDFSARLDAHVRKEEKQLFVEFETRMPAEEALKLGDEIESRLIKACPAQAIG